MTEHNLKLSTAKSLQGMRLLPICRAWDKAQQPRWRRTVSVPEWTLRLIMLSCLMVSSATFGQHQPISDGLREGRSAQYMLPKMVVDESNYAIIESSSPRDRNKLKRVDVECPDGMRAMSAGFSAPSGRGEPDDWRVTLSTPTDDGKGWIVFAMFDGSGNKDANGVYGVPAPYEWILRVRLVCAKIG